MNNLHQIYKTLLKHFGHQHWWPAKTKFEIIIGAILTQQTTWSSVEKAIRNLEAKDLIGAEEIAKCDLETIEDCVRPSGFYKQKAKRIRNISKYLVENHGTLDKFFSRELDEIRKELLSLNGIGLETADSILLYAGDKPIFVIDAYTKRMCKRLGLYFDAGYEKCGSSLKIICRGIRGYIRNFMH